MFVYDSMSRTLGSQLDEVHDEETFTFLDRLVALARPKSSCASICPRCPFATFQGPIDNAASLRQEILTTYISLIVFSP